MEAIEVPRGWSRAQMLSHSYCKQIVAAQGKIVDASEQTRVPFEEGVLAFLAGILFPAFQAANDDPSVFKRHWLDHRIIDSVLNVDGLK